MRLLVPLLAAFSAQAVLLVNSGIYTLNIGAGRALTDTGSITAAPASDAANQAWTVVVDRTAMTATVQNDETRSYVAAVNSKLAVSNDSFTWALFDTNDQNGCAQVEK